jgi:hypothetical protein
VRRFTDDLLFFCSGLIFALPKFAIMSKAIPSRSSVKPRKGYASLRVTQLDGETAKARLIEGA